MAKIPKIIFGNKEKKQFPDPEGLEREKPSSAIEGSTQPTGFETNRSRNKFSEAAPPMPGARQTLNNRLQRVGSVRRGVSLAAPRKEEVDGNMENKTFTQFVTEAKRGRPRKLRPGEQADTEHLQDQLSKLTHANHVVVHFKNGEKHEIPRAHANKALIHLSGLKPIHRADHVEHMHKSKENFYHVLTHKSIPSKKKTITLAGPKLRKEEVEVDEAVLPDLTKPTHVDMKKAALKKKGDEIKDANRAKRNRINDNKKAWGYIKTGLDAYKPGMKKEEAEQIDELSIYKMQAISKEASRRNKDYSDPKGIKHQVYGAEVADDKIVKRAGKIDPSAATKVKDWVAGKLKAKKLAKEEAESGYAIKLPSGKMAKASSGKTLWHSTKERAHATNRSSHGGEGKVVKVKLDHDQYGYNGRSVKEENDDGWYAHKEMHGSKAISKEDWKKGVRPGKSVKKEETELDEAKDADKPERSEHSWPTRRNKQGGWHWANSISGGHASAEAADRHYVNSMKKLSNTKVHIDDIKPGDRPLGKPVGLGGRSRGIPKWAKSSVKEETESDEKKKKDHHKLLQKFRHRIDEVKAIKGTHATKLHAAKVIHPDKVGYAGKQTKPKVQNLRREDYAPLEDGEKQVHVDQKTTDAKSRKQGAEKPKKPKMELTKEAWALYDTLSDKNKAIFEKMDAAERDALVDKYISGKR